jgi:hypothetical protein
MLRRECLKYGLVASAAAMVGSRRAEAGQFVAVALPELVKTSVQIWLGTPLESHAEWLDSPLGRLIVTHTRVGCEREVVRGERHPGELWVQTLGGSIGKVGQLVHGEARLALGQRCLLFLARPGERHVVNAMAQGHYAIHARDGVERLRLSPDAASLRARRHSAAAWLSDRELSAALSRIQGEGS